MVEAFIRKMGDLAVPHLMEWINRRCPIHNEISKHDSKRDPLKIRVIHDIEFAVDELCQKGMADELLQHPHESVRYHCIVNIQKSCDELAHISAITMLLDDPVPLLV